MKFYLALEKINSLETLYKEIQSLNKQLSHLKKNEADNAKKIAEKNKKIESLLAQAEKEKSALMKELGEVSSINIKKAAAIIETILRQRQVEFGLVAKEKEEDAREKVLDLPEAIKHLEEYQKYVSPGVYHALLPYSELAYLFEENGIAQEHTFKLAVLFQDRSKALSYVEAFAKQQKKGILESPDFDLLHDALLFSLPPIECDFKRWRQLAQANMQEPDFRKLLPSAKEIEKAIQLGEGMRRGKEVEDNLQILKTELSAKLKQWKKLKAHHELTEHDNKKEKVYRALTQEISELRVELVGLYAGIPWDKASYEMIRCYYERYITGESKVYNYFLQNGLTRQDYFEKFLKLNRAEASKNMPRITPEMTGAVRDEANSGRSRYVLDGSAWGFPGFYLKQIDPLNDEEAAIAACGGKLTGCCQSLSGEAGESCVKHGLTSPNGGFYVLCEGNPKRPKAEDKVWGLTWAWRSKKNQVVFDSIEMHRDLRDQVVGQGLKGEEMALTMFSGFAAEVVQKTDIVAVNSGKESGISSIFGTTGGEVQGFIDYNGYSDARSQNIIAHQHAPYLLLGKMLSKEGYEWYAKLFKAFLLENVASLGERPLVESKPLRQALEFAVIHKPELITEIKGAVGEARVKEIDAYIKQVQRLIEIKEQINLSNDDDLPETIELQELLKNINPNIAFSDGTTLLSIAIQKNHMALFKLLLSIEGLNCNQQVQDANNALTLALIQDPPNEEMILTLLKRNELDFSQATPNGSNVLTLALEARLNNKVILALLEKESLNLAQDIDTNALFVAMENRYNNIIISALLDRKDINFAQVNSKRQNALMVALEKNIRRDVILSLLSKKEINLTQKNRDGENALMIAIRQDFISEEIIDGFFKREDLDLTQVNNNGHNALMAALLCESPIYSELLQRKDLDLTQVDCLGDNALHIALGKELPDEVIMALLQRKDLNLSQVNNNGQNVLKLALEKGANKNIILALLEEKALFNTSFLSEAIGTVDSATLKILSDFWLSQIQQHVISVDRVDPQGNSLLFYAAKIGDKELIEQLLELDADPNKKCEAGQSPLDIADADISDWLKQKIKERESTLRKAPLLRFSRAELLADEIKKWSYIKTQVDEAYEKMLSDKNTPRNWDERSYAFMMILKQFCDKQPINKDAMAASESLDGLSKTVSAFKDKPHRELQGLMDAIEESIIRTGKEDKPILPSP